MRELVERGVDEGRFVTGEEGVADGFGARPTDGIAINMENIGFDGRERSGEFPLGRWLLGFAVGDIAWWLAWMLILNSAGADNLFGAVFVGSLFGASFYGTGINFLAAIITWTPFVLTAGIAYWLKFGDRSGWPILVWIGAGWVISSLTRLFLLLFLVT
jgi:hypothetical protein